MANVSDKSDRTLLDEFVRQGRDAAFAEIARRYQAMAFATAYRISGDRAEAQDILQQALIVLARRARELGEVRTPLILPLSWTIRWTRWARRIARY
jgi:DNA-directed RNA polymerase specialized sigma24 family protein